MKQAGSIALRNTSLDEKTSARPVKRMGVLKRVIRALHHSRRRQAKELVRRYRHLIAEDFRCQIASAFPDFNNEKESNRNANEDEASVRIHPRRRQHA